MASKLRSACEQQLKQAVNGCNELNQRVESTRWVEKTVGNSTKKQHNLAEKHHGGRKRTKLDF